MVLSSISYEEMIDLFLYGGGIHVISSASGSVAQASGAIVSSFDAAIHIVFWVTLASFVGAALASLLIPNSFKPPARTVTRAPTAASVINNNGTMMTSITPVTTAAKI